MATDEQALREHLIAQTTINIPKAFLEEFNRRLGRAYDEEFAVVQSDPTTLAEHKASKLIATRCFRVDWELHETAKKHGLAVTAKPLPENTWHYTYVSSGRCGLTQSYVQKLGSLPQSAKFRENLASAANMPRLPLDDPKEIYAIKDFYALLAHNPVGQRFSEDSQKLGGLQLCVPSPDMKRWVLEISVAELLSHYEAEVKRTDRTTAPIWKQEPKPAIEGKTEAK